MITEKLFYNFFFYINLSFFTIKWLYLCIEYFSSGQVFLIVYILYKKLFSP